MKFLWDMINNNVYVSCISCSKINGFRPIWLLLNNDAGYNEMHNVASR